MNEELLEEIKTSVESFTVEEPKFTNKNNEIPEFSEQTFIINGKEITGAELLNINVFDFIKKFSVKARGQIISKWADENKYLEEYKIYIYNELTKVLRGFFGVIMRDYVVSVSNIDRSDKKQLKKILKKITNKVFNDYNVIAKLLNDIDAEKDSSLFKIIDKFIATYKYFKFLDKEQIIDSYMRKNGFGIEIFNELPENTINLPEAKETIKAIFKHQLLVDNYKTQLSEEIECGAFEQLPMAMRASKDWPNGIKPGQFAKSIQYKLQTKTDKEKAIKRLEANMSSSELAAETLAADLENN